MADIETHGESDAEQAAYDAWVAEVRENVHSGERDVWRAAWIAGRDWARAETTWRRLTRSEFRLVDCQHTPSCATVDQCIARGA